MAGPILANDLVGHVVRSSHHVAAGNAPLWSATQTRRGARVLLAYRHTLLRQALRVLLQTTGVEVVAEAGDGKDAVEKAAQTRPDVVVMDTTLPILNGVEATRLILRRAPGVKVLLIATGPSDEVFPVAQSGAVGCLPHDADAAELERAIHAAWRGGSYPRPCYRATDDSSGPSGAPPEPLSLREREVLQLAADGLENQEIARRLCVSVKTVEAHKTHIMHKLNLRGRTELIKYAIRKGMIDLGEPLAAS